MKRKAAHPLVKKILSRMTDYSSDLPPFLETLAQASDFDAEAMLTALKDMVSKHDREMGLYQRALARHEASASTPEIIAARRNAQEWDEAQALRREAAQAKRDECLARLEEHDSFMMRASAIEASYEVETTNVAILQAQLAGIQRALATAEANLAAVGAQMASVKQGDERRARLVKAREQFDEVLAAFERMWNPHEVPATTDAPVPPPPPEHDPAMVAMLLDAVEGLV